MYYSQAGIEIYHGDVLEVLRSWPDAFVQTVVTSPPYWGLRDYGVPGQLGLEKTPEAYVAKMVEVFREVRRVLRDDGTLWLNLGDSYSSSTKGDNRTREEKLSASGLALKKERGEAKSQMDVPGIRRVETGLKPKDLVGIPWRVAFGLQADGWYLRSDVIWNKPNPMPESVTDRPTKAHEYIFLMSKSERYFYDSEAIKERAIYFDDDRAARAREYHKSMPDDKKNGIRPVYKDARSYDGKHTDKQRGHGRRHAGFNDRWDQMTKTEQCRALRNKRSVWTVPTAPYSEAHFATFPPNLIKPCILAGSPICGKVLDPFHGSGTTGMVAQDLNREYVGIELNEEYIKISMKRYKQNVLPFGSAA